MALALASMWPEPEVPVVVEADAKGGDLAVRFGLPQQPGLLSWAGEARRGGIRPPLAHAQQIPGGPWAVLAPPGHQQTTAALDLVTMHLRARVLWHAAEPGQRLAVLADLGRLGPEPEARTPLLEAADLVVLLSRGEPEAMAHVAARTDALRLRLGQSPRVVVIGDSPYGHREIDEVLGTDCLFLPHAPAETLGLLGKPAPRLLFGRHRLRAAARVAARRLQEAAAEKSRPAGAVAGGEVR
jgi:hypothetical protein